MYNNFKFEENEKELEYDLVIKKFEEICNPKKNETFMRYKFLPTRQSEGQSVDNFITALKTAARDCYFGDIEDSLVRDMIVIGTKDSKLQERLLRATDLTLGDAVKYAKSVEATQQHAEFMKTCSNKPSSSIDYMRKQPVKPQMSQSFSEKRNMSSTPEHINNCKFCSYSHPRGSCPAYTRTCNTCNTKGHFSRCGPKSKQVRVVEEQFSANEASSDEEECDTFTDFNFFVGALDDNDKSSNEWNIELEINNTNVSFKIDTGAQVNVLSVQTIKSLQKPAKIHPTDIKLTAYNGSAIDVLGKCITRVTKKGRSYPVQFIVSKNHTTPILGLKTCTDMNLIKRVMAVVPQNDYVAQYRNCFGPIGTLPGTHHITLDANAKPVVQPPRRIPVAMQGQLKEELDNMVKMGIIKKTTEPTDWVSSLVVVQKPNGKYV